VSNRWGEDLRPQRREGGGRDKDEPMNLEQEVELRRLWAEHRHEKQAVQEVALGYGGGMSRQEARRKLIGAGIMQIELDEEQVRLSPS
jgi:hypothetical protein